MDIQVHPIFDFSYHSRLTNAVIKCNTPGTGRRCGGLGDILCGVLGTFASWVRLEGDLREEVGISVDSDGELPVSKNVLAAWNACHITRSASRLTYKKKKRSMVSADVIPAIGGVMNEEFPVEN